MITATIVPTQTAAAQAVIKQLQVTAAAGGEDPAAVKAAAAAALHLVLHCSKCPSWRNCQREYLTERRFSYPEVLVARHTYLFVTATDPIRSGL